MLIAVFVAVLAAMVLDLRRADGTARGRGAWFAFVATGVAAALPFGAVLPIPSLAHVGSVPSFDVTRPCVAPDVTTSLHALGPFLFLRVLLPIAIVFFLARERAAPRPRFLLGFAISLASVVFAFAAVRTARGGADLAAYRTCGALTPEEGLDPSRVRAVLARTMGEARQEIIHWRDLPRLPRPPWVRSEIPVTIGGDPWVLRPRGASVVAEPDDHRAIERPLPALHFASVPSMAMSPGHTVLLDHRPDGRLYAVRVGRPVRFAEIGPLVRPPRWPLAVLGFGILFTLVVLVRLRPIRAIAIFAPYRAAPEVPPRASALLPLCALFLIEASLTSMHVLIPYL